MSFAEEPLAWLGERAGVPRTVAEIWATVDLERTLVEFGLVPAAVRGEVTDPLLGARIVVVRPGTGEATIALAEPSTEGRLAATLARHGEGPAGRYVATALDLDEVRARAAAAGVAITRRANGPFGPEVLLVGGALGSRPILLVVAAAVPSRP